MAQTAGAQKRRSKGGGSRPASAKKGRSSAGGAASAADAPAATDAAIVAEDRVGEGASSAAGAAEAAVPAEEAGQAAGLLQRSLERLREAATGKGEDLAACVQALASERFLRHPERPVRLLAAKCLAEALRIHQPGPGWVEPEQIPAALELFAEQLSLLLGAGGSVHTDALELLEVLAERRLFLLAYETADPNAQLALLVDVSLKIGRRNKVPASVLGGPPSPQQRLDTSLCRLLTGALSEAEDLPAAVVMPLLDELKPTYRSSLARRLVQAVLEELARRSAALPVNLALLAALFPQAEGEAAPTPVLPLLAVVHELFAVDPALVARVLPRLSDQFQSKDVECRRAVTELIGKMLARRRAGAIGPPLLASQPQLLQALLERLGDAEAAVRLAAVDAAGALVSTAVAVVREGRARWDEQARRLVASTAGDEAFVSAAAAAARGLSERSLDPEESVRLRVVEIAAEVSDGAETEEELRLLEDDLPTVFERVLDKRPKVREASAAAAAGLYGKRALPKWTSGVAAEGYEWIPQLLCRAYSVFLAGHVGHTAQLEELVELHLLGLAGEGGAPERARALLGFCACACASDDSAEGLRLLLGRKRDANAALRQFLRSRRSSSASSPAALGAEGTLACRPEGARAGDPAGLALEALGRLSPLLEERKARPEARMDELRALEAVKDKALWEQLDRLSSPVLELATPDRKPALAELQRLLKVHQLTSLWPLLRRSLLCTWLLPDQVPELLSAQADSGPLSAAEVQQALVELPKFFPGPFAGHAEEVVELVRDAKGPSDRFAALRVLASVGKRVAAPGEHLEQWSQVLPPLDREQFVDGLLEAVSSLATDRTARGPSCRKAVRALALLPPGEGRAARERLVQWAEERRRDPSLRATALHLAAACLQAEPEGPQSASQQAPWLEAAGEALRPSAKEPAEMRHAAAEIYAAVGGEDDIVAMLGWSGELGPSAMLHVVVFVLRALRRGTLQLTTRLLSHLSAQMCYMLAPSNPVSQVLGERLLAALQKLQRSGATCMRLADHLRLCSTLPTVFALSPMRTHQEAALRLLAASLRRAAALAARRREPLLDYAAACFLHFLSRQDFFLLEASAAASAFPDSTCVSSLLCQALQSSDASAHRTEHLNLALQVCHRSRHFVDRERPTSDAVHKASNVLRYAVERRCPELARAAAPLGVPLRGSMPAQLFAVRPASGTDQPALQDATAAAPALEAPPLPLEDAAMDCAGSKPAGASVAAKAEGARARSPHSPAGPARTASPAQPSAASSAKRRRTSKSSE